MRIGCEKRRRPRRRNGRASIAAAATNGAQQSQAKGNPKGKGSRESARTPGLFTLVAHKEPNIMRDLCATCFYASTSIVRLYFIERCLSIS